MRDGHQKLAGPLGLGWLHVATAPGWWLSETGSLGALSDCGYWWVLQQDDSGAWNLNLFETCCGCMVVVVSDNIDVSRYVASLVWGSTWRQDSWYEITWIDCQNVMLYELVSWCDFSRSFSTSMCMTLSPEFETSALSFILLDAVFYGHYLSRLLGPLEF